MNFILVFIGGGAGSVIRYLIGLLFQKSGLHLPIATLLANVLACILFAVCVNLLYAKTNEGTLKLLLLTGFCGGLSTFSTFGYETYLLIKQNNLFWAFANICISLALCTGAFFVIKK